MFTAFGPMRTEKSYKYEDDHTACKRGKFWIIITPVWHCSSSSFNSVTKTVGSREKWTLLTWSRKPPSVSTVSRWIATEFSALGLCRTWLNSQDKLNPQSMSLSATRWSSERWNHFQSVSPRQIFPYANHSLGPTGHSLSPLEKSLVFPRAGSIDENSI